MIDTRKPKPKNKEQSMYPIIARFMRYQYPEVIFRFDHAAGMYMTINQAKKHSSINPIKGYPDLFIAKARHGYYGLFLELKAEGESPFLKSGDIKSAEHIQRQNKILKALHSEGYLATFGVGIEEILNRIRWYLG
jgi:hypothetical protein